MGSVDIPFDSIWCPVCARQIVPKRIDVPVQPLLTVPASRSSNVTQCKASQHPDDSSCLARDKTASGFRSRAPDLIHNTTGAGPHGTIKPPPAPVKDIVITHVPQLAAPVRRRVVIDQTSAPLYCSEECRLGDLQSCGSAINIKHKDNPGPCTSPFFPPTPPNSAPNVLGSQGDNESSGASLGSDSSASSPVTVSPAARASPPNGDCCANVYSKLAAIYGFAPLPPPPPFTPKPTSPAAKPASHLEGSIMPASCRIQAALCTKTVTFICGLPVHSDPEDDNKPIPGWTDGSNAWRASTYGLAPPRDFTRADPDYAAIRAYSSYVATPHRSCGGVHSTLTHSNPNSATQAKTSRSLPYSPPPPIDASTQELYRQYSVSFTRRFEYRQRASTHACGLCLAPTTGSTCPCTVVREVSLLMPGAEGHLLVPDVKMRRRRRVRCVSAVASGVSKTKSGNGELGAAGHSAPARSFPTTSKARPTTHAQSYASEAFTYPIMRIAPKKEKRIEQRLVGGVECNVEVEVEVEEPIKRLFLFRGACD